MDVSGSENEDSEDEQGSGMNTSSDSESAEVRNISIELKKLIIYISKHILLK